jgi:hypothetical protein
MSQGELDSFVICLEYGRWAQNHTIFLHNLYLALFQCFTIPNTIIANVDISKKLENESGIKVVLKPTEEEMEDDDEQDI